MLSSADYTRYMNDLQILKMSPQLSSSPPFNFTIPQHYQQQHNSIPAYAPESQQQRPPLLPVKQELLGMGAEELIKLAKNPGLTKYFQEQIQQCSQMRHKFYEVLTEQGDGADLLTRLAYDCTGNFIIQVDS
jgi:hypothetical protein